MLNTIAMIFPFYAVFVYAEKLLTFFPFSFTLCSIYKRRVQSLMSCSRSTGHFDRFGDGEYDELAVWNRQLIINGSVDEREFFFGGYCK